MALRVHCFENNISIQGTDAAEVHRFSRQRLVPLVPVHPPVVIATNSVDVWEVRQ